MTTSEHAKPLQPGEIRTHTVGDKTFQIMHTGNGAYTQATVRTAGVPTTTVLATVPFEHVAVKIYAEAIERAEVAAEVDHNLPMGANPGLVYGETANTPADVPQPLRADRAIAELRRFEEIDSAAVARGESADWWDRGANTPAESRTGTSDRVAAALNELAALRSRVEFMRPLGDRLAVERTYALLQIDRAVELLKAEGGPVPQRATDAEGWGIHLHTCGAAQSAKRGDGVCRTCGVKSEDDGWRALYTLGGE